MPELGEEAGDIETDLSDSFPHYLVAKTYNLATRSNTGQKVHERYFIKANYLGQKRIPRRRRGP